MINLLYAIADDEPARKSASYIVEHIARYLSQDLVETKTEFIAYRAYICSSPQLY